MSSLKPFTIILLAVTVVVPARADAANWLQRRMSPICLSLTEMRTVTEDTTTLRLFESGGMKGALRIGKANPNGSSLEKKFLNTYAKEGLKDVISTREGALLLIEYLKILDAVKETPTDPFYAEMVLAARNDQVDLRVPYRDNTIDTFLRARKYIEKAEWDSKRLDKYIPPILPKASSKRRAEFLYWQTLKALDRIPDSSDESISSVIATFAEIARIDENVDPDPTTGKVTPEAHMAAMEKILLHGSAASILGYPAEIKINEDLKETADELPPTGFGAHMLVSAFNHLFLRNREAKTRVINPAEELSKGARIGKFLTGDDLYEEVPNSYTAGIIDRDPWDYGPKATAFLAKFLVKGKLSTALFSPQFADELERAYPELRTLRNVPGVDENAVGVRGGYIKDGPFGPGTYEGYKVMNRAALFLALVRGDAQYFPRLTPADFAELRRNFLKEMKLVDSNGEVSVKAADEFMSYLMVDTLGRGRSLFLDTLETEHGFKEQSGTDYERRSVLILNTYAFSSYSYARLDDEAQSEIRDRFNYIYYYNTGQALQLEGSRWSFNHFGDGAADKTQAERADEIAGLYYRSLLSFAALPIDSDGKKIVMAGSSSLETNVFKKWDAFRENIISLVVHGKTPEQAYVAYVTWLAREFNLPLEDGNEEQFAVVRLAAQSRSVTAEQAAVVAAQFNELTPDEKEILIKAETEYPILNYGAADVIAGFAIESDRGKLAAPYSQKPFLAAMKVLARVYKELSNSTQFQLAVRSRPHEQIKVNLRYVVQFAMQNDPLLLLNDAQLLFKRLKDGSFEFHAEKPL